jgi:hypothetical protein
MPRREDRSPITLTGVIFRGLHFHGHHGFQNHGVGLAATFLETEDGSHLEREFVRVHIVVRTEVSA